MVRKGPATDINLSDASRLLNWGAAVGPADMKELTEVPTKDGSQVKAGGTGPTSQGFVPRPLGRQPGTLNNSNV